MFVERKKLEQFELSRVGRFFIMGSCVVAPCIRAWYLILEKIVKLQGTKAALSKMVLDQAFFAPSFLVLFVSAASTLQGLTFQVQKLMWGLTFIHI